MTYEPICQSNFEIPGPPPGTLISLINEGWRCIINWTQSWWSMKNSPRIKNIFLPVFHPMDLLCPLGRHYYLIIDLTLLYIIILYEIWERVIRGACFFLGFLLFTDFSRILERPCQNQYEFSEWWNIPQFWFWIISVHSRLCGTTWILNGMVIEWYEYTY